MDLSVVQEDYLKSIWKLNNSADKVSVKKIADSLQVKSSTVVSMLTYLANAELLTYDKIAGAALSQKGEYMARKLIRKHRLVETFLKNVLNLQGEILHREAEKLEHVISDQLMFYIDTFLGFPRTDPHGVEIPMLRQQDIRFRISDLQIGQSFEIYHLHVNSEDLKYCKRNHLNIGSIWSVKEITPAGEAVMISDGTLFIALSQKQGEQIEVTLLAENSLPQ